MKYTDKQLLDRVESLDTFKGWPRTVVDIWVRSRADLYDQFDDKVYTYEPAKTPGERPKFIMVCTGTTNAGSEGLKNFAKYNREGCAVLKSDVIIYESHIYGLHKGQYPAYRQNRAFPYYRDGNRNNKAEEIGRVRYDIIGANCHKAGWFSTRIGGWSVACLVRNRQAQYDAWMRFMNKRPLTVAILKEF